MQSSAGRVRRLCNSSQEYSTSSQVFFVPVAPQIDQVDRSASKKRTRKERKTKRKPVKSGQAEHENGLLTYCKDTSLHGFKYFAKKNLGCIERPFWAVALAVVYALVTYLLWGQISDFIESPVLISFEPEPTLISTLPFPTLTLCPDMKIRKSVFNLTEASQPDADLTEDEKGLLMLSSVVCDIVFHQHMKTRPWAWFFPEAIRNFSHDHSSRRKCRDFVAGVQCALRDVPDPCFYFQPSYTELGACFSFNLLPLKQLFQPSGWEIFRDESLLRLDPIWSPDNGYEVPSKKQVKPGKNGSPPWAASNGAVVSGYNFFLHVPLHLFDERCLGARGFHGYLHNPAEAPNSRHTYFYLSPNQHLDIKVEPKVQTASSNLLRWTPQQRMCYMQFERKMEFFTFYTQKNCELECTANFSLELCNCVPFNLPRGKHTRVCGPRSFDCLSEISGDNSTSRAVCNCLPACSEIEYGAQFTSVEKDWTESNYMPYNKSHDALHMSLHIHYRTKYVQAIKRSESKTFVGLVASVGGLIGLFTGFSMLSLVEIFHHLILNRTEKLESPVDNSDDSTADEKIEDNR